MLCLFLEKSVYECHACCMFYVEIHSFRFKLDLIFGSDQIFIDYSCLLLKMVDKGNLVILGI